MTRFLLYSHDTYGLGHFRRSTTIAQGLIGADGENEVLIVTGSPRSQAFRLPERVDTVKLPAATKDDGGSYRPRKLCGSLDDLVELRAEVIAASVEAYRPHAILVDHAPLGMGGELRTMLRAIPTGCDSPRLFLGLRDIIDDHRRVDASWQQDGVWEELRRYDEILVYGDASVSTTAQELRLDRRFDGPVTHTGYVTPRMPDPVPTDPFVLVTPGGGGDGQNLLRRYLDAVESGALANIRSVIVTGPLLSASRRAELMTRAAQMPAVELVEFSDRMRTLVSSALGVVSMAGYNTVVEELASETRALLVPRRRPRVEQQLRAERLAPRSGLEHARLGELTPSRVGEFVRRCLASAHADHDLDLGGVATTVNCLRAGLPARTPAHA